MEIILKNTSLKFKTSYGKVALDAKIGWIGKTLWTTNYTGTSFSSGNNVGGTNLVMIDVHELIGKTLHIEFNDTYNKKSPGGSKPAMVTYGFCNTNGSLATITGYTWLTPFGYVPITEDETLPVAVDDDVVVPEGAEYLVITETYGSQVGDDVSSNVTVWYIDN